jgi:hypothetical protein
LVTYAASTISQFLKFCGMDSRPSSLHFPWPVKPSYQNTEMPVCAATLMVGQVAIPTRQQPGALKFERYIAKDRHNTHLRKAYPQSLRWPAQFTGR